MIPTPAKSAYPPGTRVRVTQHVRVGHRRWLTRVEGVVEAEGRRPVGGIEMGGKASYVQQPTLRLRRDDGEITEVAMDASTQVEVITDPAAPVQAVATPTGPDPVILVHGTFSYDEEEAVAAGENRWWQRNSSFCKQLDTLISPNAICTPPGADLLAIRPWWYRWVWEPLFNRSSPGIGVPTITAESVFHWSGDNSESARRAAGQLLLAHLRQFDDQGRHFHVVAHSHGGSVLWEALCLAESGGRPLKYLKSWTTVGAPFIGFRTDPSRLLLALPLAIAAGAAFYLQWAWFADYWSQRHPESDTHWFYVFLAVLLETCLRLAVLAMLARFLWAVFSWHVGTSRPYDTMTRARERDDIVSSALALLTLTAVSFTAMALPAAVRDRACPASLLDPRAYPEFIRSIIREPGDYAACLWFTMMALAAVGAVLVLAAVGWRRIDDRRRANRRAKAWSRYGGIYQGIAYAKDDEAILALRTARRQIEGPLLPRFPSPRERDFSEPNQRHLRRPERLFAWGSMLGWLTQYILLPISMVVNWVVLQFLYNQVFVEQVERFVLDQLQKRATGNDVFGLKVDHVVDHPMGDPQTGLPAAGCSREAKKRLVWRTIRNAPFLVRALRRALALDGYEKAHFDLFLDAMGGKARVADCLIHTSYFDEPAVRSDIAARVRGEAPANPPWPPRAARPRVRPRRGQAAINLWNAFVFVLNGALRYGVAVLAPTLLLLWLGRWSLYGDSLEYHVRWASDPSLALGAVLDERNPDPNPMSAGLAYDSPLAVRWWVARKLLDPSADVAAFASKIASVNKRVLFFGRVGQKFAELRLVKEAADAFGLATKAMTDNPGTTSDMANRVSNIALCLSAARRVLQPGQYKDVSARTTPEVRAALEAAAAPTFKSKDLFDGYRSLAGDGDPPPPPAKVLDWALRQPGDKDQDKLRKLAFLIGFARTVQADGKDLVAEFQQTASDALKEIDSLPTKEIDRRPTKETVDALVRSREQLALRSLKDDLRLILTVAESQGDRNSPLFGTAATFRDRIDSLTEGSGTGRDFADQIDLRTTVALAHSLRGREARSKVEQLLSDARTILDHPRNQDRHDSLLRWVAGSYAQAGDYTKAGQLVGDGGPRTRLYVALQYLMKEIERRRADGTFPFKDRGLDAYDLRQALEQDIGIERDDADAGP